MEELPKINRRIQALELYVSGFSVRKTAKIIGVSPSTVSRWIRRTPPRKRGRPKKVREIPEELREKLMELIFTTTQRKGQIRAKSLRQIYYMLEPDLKLIEINSLQSFYRFVKEFVSKEELENKENQNQL